MSEWIPTSERLPTKEDVGINPKHPNCVHAQDHSGWLVLIDFRDVSEATCVAWRRLPELYVPPEPEKPKRKEFNEVASVTYWNKRELVTNALSGEWIDKIREVLPGDCDPDGARQVLKRMRDSLPALVGPADIEKWIKLLEGRP